MKKKQLTNDPILIARNEAEEQYHQFKYAEKRWIKLMKARTPEGWRQLIDKIPKKFVQIKVASIVYWDYLSSKEAINTPTHLNDLIAAWRPEQDPKESEVKQALFKLGYTKREATRRAKKEIKDDSETEE